MAEKTSNKWITYGRVAPIPKSWGEWEGDKYNLFVHVVCFLPDWRPNYAIGKHLRIETDTTIYLIYNPQKLQFNLNGLLSGAKTWIKQRGDKFIGYSIEDSYGKY